MELPDPLPALKERIRVVSPYRQRAYLNYCTLGYTAAWWDWNRWEREIDFMALNGINMPLAVTGIEGAWYHALLRLGMTDQQAREFLVGPAYQAWQWMQNIERYGGPLPKSWIDSHVRLGRQILDRERALGMTPIQQGFSGAVPRRLKEMFPAAAMKQQPMWCGVSRAPCNSIRSTRCSPSWEASSWRSSNACSARATTTAATRSTRALRPSQG